MGKKNIAVLVILSISLAVLLSVFIMIKSVSPPDNSSTDITGDIKITTATENIFETESETEPEETPEQEADKIEKFIMNMTLEQKIGQMFFCAFRQDGDGNDVVEINEDIINIIKNCGIGGVVLFSENIKDSEQVKNYISSLQRESDITLFIGIDEEGGRVSRTSELDVPRIPAALSIGKTEKPAMEAAGAGKIIAGYLSPLGFNVDFAPVADVFTNPSNTVIGDRAFSSDPDIAAELVKCFLSGLTQNGILPAIKHFPGHGDTGEDSHYGIAETKKTLEELSECEFIPFKMGIDENVPFVMTGHISAPNVTGDDLPATFSDYLLRGILRGMLGFDGIIITDSLSMGAVTNYYTPEETAVKSVLAGVDMLLIPVDFYRAYNGLLNAVKSGEITEEQIDESVKRILTVKYNFGLLELKPD